MSLTGVKISEEVWSSCLTHSLSTETEEVMGLLLGDIQQDNETGEAIAMIWSALAQRRLDRRKDRVEATPEQLAAAAAEAEKLTKVIGNTTRVIGWYHSHPHITVLPSHVDIRTQAILQQLDPGFVGLIFSCFNDDTNMVGRIQAIAFQSVKEGLLQCATAQQADYASPELMSFMKPSADSDSPCLTSSDDKTSLSALSPGMQEAMHLSSLDMSSAEFIRKEIPMDVVPLSSFGLLKPPPDPKLSLQKMLFDEEKATYTKAMLQSKEENSLHFLASLHHSTTYQTALCRLMELCLFPAMTSELDKLEQNRAKLALLEDETTSLELESVISRC